MSGLPFNPMRKTPPPPPHVDTVGLCPTDYVLVASSDGHVFIVHRDCLCGSPALRRAFAKRLNVTTEDVVVVFDDAARAVHTSISPWDQPPPAEKVRVSSQAVNGSDSTNAEVAFAPVLDDRGAGDEDDAAQRAASDFRPVIVHESLQNDSSIVITFPRHHATVVDLLIAYLYYKLRYDGVVNVERPMFDVPREHAIELMKLAQVLEC